MTSVIQDSPLGQVGSSIIIFRGWNFLFQGLGEQSSLYIACILLNECCEFFCLTLDVATLFSHWCSKGLLQKLRIPLFLALDIFYATAPLQAGLVFFQRTLQTIKQISLERTRGFVQG